MTRAELITEVEDVITTNGNREITGEVLRTLLTTMINNMPVLGVDNGLRTYNSASVYQVGDSCIFSGQIFGCNTADTTGVFNPSKWDLLSGLYTVADNTERDAIVFRHEGMECYVLGTGMKYQLIGGVSNGDWVHVNGTQVYAYAVAVESNGQTVFSAVPDRDLLSVKINGLEYDASNYALSAGNGTTQTLTWSGVGLLEEDVLSIIYKGSEI